MTTRRVVLAVFAIAVVPGAAAPAPVANWEKGTWQAEGSLFFSGIASIDAFLKGAAGSNPPPLTPAYRTRSASLEAEMRAHPSFADPLKKCYPLGIPLALAAPFPLKFQFSADYVILLSESGYRTIWLAGKPDGAEIGATFGGYSTGRWDGDTLVIDTTDLVADSVLEPGIPHSDHLSVIERWRQIGADRLKNDITITDPLALTAPWHVTRTYTRTSDQALKEKPCI